MRTLLSALLLAPALSGTPLSDPIEAPTARRTVADTLGDRLRRTLTPWLEEQAKRGAFSGVVLVAREGREIYSSAWGMADRARGVPNTVETRFNLGSMNKMWTAVAIAQLAERALVDLDAPVGRYVPELPNRTIRERVTIRHLLSHTSGMGSYFENGFLQDHTYAATPVDYVPFYAGDSLAFAPGERMGYSNAGFALLGLIVERASGRPYYEYMRERVLEPAGMTGAAFLDLRARPTDVAVGYAAPEGGRGAAEPNWDLIEPHSSPAGGAYARAADLVAFSRALWGGRLVGPELVREFTTGKVAMGPQMQYGYGFGTAEIAGWRQVGHNGGAPGVNAEMMMFPDQGIDVVVLSNMDPPAATAAIGQVVGALTGVRLRLMTGGRGGGRARAARGLP
ncbi:MAG TPA: serine hydrolase domain-containing protein [Gemmatimonadales bacterium]